MTATKYNARDIDFQISDGDPDSPTWTDINGMNTFTKSEDGKDTDTTTFSSEGEAESEIMERSKSMKWEGFRLLDASTGATDPGQALVETLAQQVGTASLGQVRWASPGDTTWEVWTCNATMGDVGGGNNDKTSWSVTVTRSGASGTMDRS